MKAPNLSLFVIALVACASGTAPSSGAAGTGAADTPADKCIAAANVRPKPKADAAKAITVSHILVKHADSKNPKEGVTRSRGDACLRAAAARDEITGGKKTFDAAVGEYSDEAGAATRGGSLGEITRESAADPAFADAAFDLDRGQMSDVVETPYGFHLIMRKE